MLFNSSQFGAGIFVANLVAVAMAREMGAIMTGIIMAGRTGAAFAAQIGSMKVSAGPGGFGRAGVAARLTPCGFAARWFLAPPHPVAVQADHPKKSGLARGGW